MDPEAELREFSPIDPSFELSHQSIVQPANDASNSQAGHSQTDGEGASNNSNPRPTTQGRPWSCHSREQWYNGAYPWGVISHSWDPSAASLHTRAGGLDPANDQCPRAGAVMNCQPVMRPTPPTLIHQHSSGLW